MAAANAVFCPSLRGPPDQTKVGALRDTMLDGSDPDVVSGAGLPVVSANSLISLGPGGGSGGGGGGGGGGGMS